MLPRGFSNKAACTDEFHVEVVDGSYKRVVEFFEKYAERVSLLNMLSLLIKEAAQLTKHKLPDKKASADAEALVRWHPVLEEFTGTLKPVFHFTMDAVGDEALLRDSVTKMMTIMSQLKKNTEKRQKIIFNDIVSCNWSSDQKAYLLNEVVFDKHLQLISFLRGRPVDGLGLLLSLSSVVRQHDGSSVEATFSELSEKVKMFCSNVALDDSTKVGPWSCNSPEKLQNLAEDYSGGSANAVLCDARCSDGAASFASFLSTTQNRKLSKTQLKTLFNSDPLKELWENYLRKKESPYAFKLKLKDQAANAYAEGVMLPLIDSLTSFQ